MFKRLVCLLGLFFASLSADVRAQLVSEKGDQPYNWLFLPGGPGADSTYHLPDIAPAITAFQNDPSDETFKEALEACLPYYCDETHKEAMRVLLNVPFNWQPNLWFQSYCCARL